MKRVTLFLLGAVLLAACNGGRPATEVSEAQPVRLILDTDLGPDYDDVGAIALMHALADSGYVNVLATISSNKDERVVPCIEVLNTYFDRPDLPFDTVAVDIDVAGAPLRIEAEVNADLRQQPHDGILVNHARTNGAMFERIKCDGTVHGTRIDENISQPSGNGLCEGRFPAAA